MQGHLRRETLTVAVETQCACCGRAIELEIDDKMRCRVPSEARILLTVPLIDIGRLKAPNIIDDF